MEVTSEVKAARRLLHSIAEYELLEDLAWLPTLKSWMMKIKLNVDVAENEFIPSSTVWHVLISSEYPKGSIKFYPNKLDGVKSTHPHQNYNHAFDEKVPFSGGDPCLNTKQGSWGRSIYSSEPTGKERLKWHVIRCIDWIKAAASKKLFQEGDPIELPTYPSLTDYQIIFNEDEVSFSKWSSSVITSGIAEIKTVSQLPRLYVVFNFLGHEKDDPATKWGEKLATVELQEHNAIWLKINQLPVEDPWQIPSTIGDLIKVLALNGIDLKGSISNHYHILRRKGKSLSFILLGFPLPKRIGETNSLMHWIAFELKDYPNSKGFTKASHALFDHELNVVLSSNRKIKWVKTENWNENQITKRGALRKELTDSRILLVGCGAVGSLLADQIVRLSCKQLKLVDGEKLHVGNLSRHALLFTDVENSKAEAMCKKLNATLPFVKVTFDYGTIQEVMDKNPNYIEDHDIIIEATGNDSVLELLSEHAAIFPNKIFISASTGYKADRFFLLVYKSGANEKSLVESFRENFKKWHDKEREASENTEELVDGIGCWHPLFPARIDDLHMHIGASIKLIEKAVDPAAPTISFHVIEKQYSAEGIFSGLIIKS